MKIISGGQTGVDRAALDAALEHGIECGGWCPAGRLNELGKIPQRYPLQEVKQHVKEGAALWEPKSDIFAERTLRNVENSDGTIVIYPGRLRGGSEYTIKCCSELKRPDRSIDAAKISPEEAAELIVEFVRKERIRTLNVAGPRQSEWPGGYDYAFRVLDIFLATIKTGCSL